MSTDVVTKNNEMVGVRRASVGGSKVWMDLTEKEYEAWKNVEVSLEHHNDWKPMHEWVKVWDVVWETPKSLNDRAKQLENHRWANDGQVGSWMTKQATEYRMRARQATKDVMRVV